MVVEAPKALTWGTLAAAVFSALLLASEEGGMSRVASMVSDATRSPPASSACPAMAGPRGTGNAGAQRRAEPTRGAASH